MGTRKDKKERIQVELYWGTNLLDVVQVAEQPGTILAGWERPDGLPLTFYEPGSWGPSEADSLLAQDSRAWYHYCGAHNGNSGE